MIHVIAFLGGAMLGMLLMILWYDYERKNVSAALVTYKKIAEKWRRRALDCEADD
jgi:hypothetical protein